MEEKENMSEKADNIENDIQKISEHAPEQEAGWMQGEDEAWADLAGRYEEEKYFMEEQEQKILKEYGCASYEELPRAARIYLAEMEFDLMNNFGAGSQRASEIYNRFNGVEPDDVTPDQQSDARQDDVKPATALATEKTEPEVGAQNHPQQDFESSRDNVKQTPDNAEKPVSIALKWLSRLRWSHSRPTGQDKGNENFIDFDKE